MTVTRAPQRRRLILFLIVGVVAVAIILIVSLLRPSETTPQTAPTPSAGQSDSTQEAAAPKLSDLARRVDGDVAALGAVDAPVVLIEYADYRCPYCGVFAQNTLPTLVTEYVDSGQLRIEWRDTPVFGEDSLAAAIAARAAGQQGLFWEYNHAVYAYQGDSRKDLPREQLIAIASEIGVPDLAAFELALDDPDLHNTVMVDAVEAQSLGVQSTPSFIIGETAMMGAQPLDVFRQVIEDELARVAK